jgi:hypothetical protein
VSRSATSVESFSEPTKESRRGVSLPTVYGRSFSELVKEFRRRLSLSAQCRCEPEPG